MPRKPSPQSSGRSVCIEMPAMRTGRETPCFFA